MSEVSASAHADDFSLALVRELEDGLSDDVRAQIKSELEPGERVLWAAQSNPPVDSRGLAYYIVCMITLVFFGMGLFFIIPPRAGPNAAGDSTIGLGIVLLVIDSLFMIGLTAGWNGRRKHRRQMANTYYAITDRRVIIWVPEPTGDAVRVQALERGEFKHLVRIERTDGSGSLEFSAAPRDADFGYYHRFMLANIPAVRRVEQIVRNNLMTRDQVTCVNREGGPDSAS
jgi:hypothetical protein